MSWCHRCFAVVTAVVLIAVISLLTGCSSESAPSVFSVFILWLQIKSSLGALDHDPQDVSGIENQLEEFLHILNRFYESPLGKLYETQEPGVMQNLDAIVTAAERLKGTLHSIESASVFSITLEIDEKIAALQRIDTGLSNRSQLQYFQLFFFLSMLIIIIILVLGILNNRLLKAKYREQENLEFSREFIVAQENERERIARELHDTVAQDLWRLSFQTDMIDKTPEGEERSRISKGISKDLRNIIKQIRAICDSLLPPDFRYREFPQTIQSLANEFKRRTGIECSVTIKENFPANFLSPGMQLNCYRILQESLANIEKHAKATEVSIFSYVLRNDTLCFSISDNGIGFPAPDLQVRDQCMALRREGHSGIWNMYERTALLNGKLSLESAPGKGTAIALQFTLANEKEKP